MPKKWFRLFLNCFRGAISSLVQLISVMMMNLLSLRVTKPQSVNRSVSQIPQYIKQIPHSAPLCNRNVHTCYKMVHCGIGEIGLLQHWFSDTPTIAVITWAPWRLKPKAIRLFVQKFAHDNSDKNSKTLHYWHFVVGISGGFPHKRVSNAESVPHAMTSFVSHPSISDTLQIPPICHTAKIHETFS